MDIHETNEMKNTAAPKLPTTVDLLERRAHVTNELMINEKTNARMNAVMKEIPNCIGLVLMVSMKTWVAFLNDSMTVGLGSPVTVARVPFEGPDEKITLHEKSLSRPKFSMKSPLRRDGEPIGQYMAILEGNEVKKKTFLE